MTGGRGFNRRLLAMFLMGLAIGTAVYWIQEWIRGLP